MTDARLTGEKSETLIEQVDGDGSFRLTGEKSETFLSEAPSTLRVTGEKSEAWVTEPPGTLRVSAFKTEILMTRNHPYLQDMYGHFVHSFVGGNIRPIQSLLEYY